MISMMLNCMISDKFIVLILVKMKKIIRQIIWLVFLQDDIANIFQKIIYFNK